jgi:hypothetical protein
MTTYPDYQFEVVNTEEAPLYFQVHYIERAKVIVALNQMCLELNALSSCLLRYFCVLSLAS